MSENKPPRKDKLVPSICKWCGVHKGVMKRYGMHICRRCFKDNALKMGWTKYS